MAFTSITQFFPKDGMTLSIPGGQHEQNRKPSRPRWHGGSLDLPILEHRCSDGEGMNYRVENRRFRDRCGLSPKPLTLVMTFDGLVVNLPVQSHSEAIGAVMDWKKGQALLEEHNGRKQRSKSF